MYCVASICLLYRLSHLYDHFQSRSLIYDIMWHCVVSVITKGKGSFCSYFGTKRCKAHLLCKLDPLSALRSSANWPSFQSHEYTSKGPPDGCCRHSWPSCPGHPSQFRTEASQATDPVIYTLDSCAPSQYVLSPNVVSERRFEGKIGCMGAG